MIFSTTIMPYGSEKLVIHKIIKRKITAAEMDYADHGLYEAKAMPAVVPRPELLIEFPPKGPRCTGLLGVACYLLWDGL